MAFDGITIAAITQELDQTLAGGRINKIAQPEPDELLLTIKVQGTSRRLLMSADAALPLIYLTETNKQAPMTAPGFCMLLRKHLQNARIIGFYQPGLERCIHMQLEHLDELGDLSRKELIMEVMGKHSNLIFCKEDGTIIDSIKHISGAVSSVREVLPGRVYFLPQTAEKLDLMETCEGAWKASLTQKPMPTFKALYNTFTGLSPILSQELCFRAGIDADHPANCLSESDQAKLCLVLSDLKHTIQSGTYSPSLVRESGVPKEYGAIPLTLYRDLETEPYASISELLEAYYAQKNIHTRIRQRSTDLRRIVQTALERNIKKYDLQIKQMKDTEKKDQYRIWGEMLHTYGYQIPEGAAETEVINYYTNEPMRIPLDPTLSPSQNAQKYFDKYGKMKRTFEALSQLTIEVEAEIRHLESVQNALDIAESESDLLQIRSELIETGYIRKRSTGKKERNQSVPLHFVSSDGFHLYVGKNNLQNDELTFRFANGGDWWFHAKKAPGSHVILKTEGRDVPDRAFEEAAALAAYYSKAKDQEKVEIDYIERKHVKKPAGAKPGFVVYYTNYSMAITPNISMLQKM